MVDRAQQQTRWSTGVAYLGLGLALVVALLIIVRALKVESPASHHAQTLLRVDASLGATLEPLDQGDNGNAGRDQMVVTSIATGGRAAQAGIRVGDVVERIGGKDAADLDQLSASLGHRPIPVVINRRGTRATVVLPERPSA